MAMKYMVQHKTMRGLSVKDLAKIERWNKKTLKKFGPEEKYTFIPPHTFFFMRTHQKEYLRSAPIIVTVAMKEYEG